MNYKVNGIKMTLKLLDLDLHRIAHLSNIQNFGDVNLYNFLTIKLISLHLEGFLFGTTSSIFTENFIKICLVVCFKISKKACSGSSQNQQSQKSNFLQNLSMNNVHTLRIIARACPLQTVQILEGNLSYRFLENGELPKLSQNFPI